LERVRTITEAQVQKALSIEKTIDLAREAYFRFARHEALNPERSLLTVPNGISLYCMSAYVAGRSTVAVKLARANPANRKLDFPTVMARVNVYDAKTGKELAQIEGETLTALRTAASSAVATDLLASKDADTLGVFGTGRQAEAHIPAIVQVRNLRKILVYSRNKQRRMDFVKKMEERTSVQMVAAKSAEKVVKNSNILVLATNSTTPLFDGKIVKPGTHVNAIGGSLPNEREMDTDLVRRSLLVVDSKAQALSTYGDIVIPLKEGAIDETRLVELGELLVDPGRAKREEGRITIFKSGGLAVLDAIMADYLLTSAGSRRRVC
jgi:ornithine cyclodeaminase